MVVEGVEEEKEEEEGEEGERGERGEGGHGERFINLDGRVELTWPAVDTTTPPPNDQPNKI